MQTRDNLERMVVIKAFIAVRVLGLRQGGISEETQNDSCEKNTDADRVETAVG